MENTEKKVKNADSKRHVGILIGIALILLGLAFAYFAVSQPGVSGNNGTAVNGTSSQQTEATEIPPSDETPTAEMPVEEEAPQTSGTPTEAPTSPASTTAPDVTEAKTTAPTVTVQYPLNLNTCTAAELMTIDGIGEARASAIIAYREYLGGYTDVEQLKNISGIGDGIFAKLEPYVTV